MYLDAFKFYVFRYTSKQPTWWQSIRGIEAIITKILLKTSQENKIIAWDKFTEYPSLSATYWASHIGTASEFQDRCCHFIEIIPIYRELDLYDYYTPSVTKEAILYFYPLGTDLDVLIKAMKQFGFKVGINFPKKDTHKYSEFMMYGSKSGYMQDFFIGTNWNLALFHNPGENKLTYLGTSVSGHWPNTTYRFNMYED